MISKYSQEQIEQSLTSLPEELKEALFSVETANAIRSACEKQGITDNRQGAIAELAGQVLLGLISPIDFQKALVSDIKLSTTIAEPIFREINRFVFFPVKAAIEKLHEIPTEKTSLQPSTVKIIKARPDKQKSKKTAPDKYRESI